jgi:glutamyl-tRNA reductase
MKFIAYGLNHTTAPLSVREKYALPPEKVMEILKSLKSHAPEALFLSTCNRVEFYLASERVEECLDEIHQFLGSFHRLKPAELKKYFYFYEGTEAFLHLFRVAGSLDSMVVGEAQILGQVKEAFQESREAGMSKTILNGVFSRAFAAAKRVRSQTEIARMPVNVSSVAVNLARKIFSPLSEHQVLLVGAGEMGELTAKYLADAGVSGFFIANRTREKGRDLAARLGGTALSLEEGIQKLEQVDIVITSVGGDFVIRKPELEKAMKSRGRRPLFLIDTGVPRNIEPEAGKLEAVYLYNIDNLSAIAQANLQERAKAVEAAEEILREEVDKLCGWLASLELVPTVVKLRERFEKIRQAEWEEFLRKNQSLPEKERKLVERLTKDMLGKLLHDPTVHLKAIENEADRFEYARMLNEIFTLNQNSGDQ